MRGRGVPGLRGGRGDLVVTIAVETPTRLDPRQEELLRELAAIRGEEQPAARVRPDTEGCLRPAPRRVQPALMSLPRPPGAVPGRGGRGLGGDRRGRRGAPRGRRTPARGRRARAAHRRRSAWSRECEVAETGKQRLVAAVRSVRSEPRPQPAVVVVQALPKGDRGELAVEVLTEVGVARIVPWAAARSVAVWRGDRAAEVAGPLARHRPRGGQAGPTGLVPGGRRAGLHRRRRRRWSRQRRSRWCCTRRRPSRWPPSTSRPRAGRAGRRTRGRAGSRRARRLRRRRCPHRPPRRRGAAHVDRRRRRRLRPAGRTPRWR